MTVPAPAVDALVDWYGRTARDLPWRRTRDPYRILVSEIMLQQTRVETVEPRYERFLQRFPDLGALADADEEEVLAEWSGLGYYRRARFLHRLARVVAAEHGGELPRPADALRELPGIGDYTAAAVSSIAHDLPHLAIDGNIERVLCRLLAIDGDPRRAATRGHLRDAMAAPLRRHPAGTVNQALMDLGARVCLPANARCDECPVARWCQARRMGCQDRIPPSRRAAIEQVEEAAAVIEREGELLLFRGQRPGSLTEMWEFPTLDSRLRPASVAERADLSLELRSYLAERGLQVSRLTPVGTVRHAITTRRITCWVYRARLDASSAGTDSAAAARAPHPVTSPLAGPLPLPAPAPAPEPAPERGWFHHDRVPELPVAAATTKILRLLEQAAPRLGF